MPHVRRRMLVRLAATEADVRSAATAVLPAREEADGSIVVDVENAPTPGTHVRLDLAPAPTGGTLVAAAGRTDLTLPFFAWAILPLVRLSLRRNARHALEAVRVEVEGGEPPPPPRAVSALPDVAFSHEQAILLATAAAATAIAVYGGALFGQFADYIAKSFGTSNASLGNALAVTRVGVLLSLVATALADRRGRRLLVIASVVGVCVTNVVAAVAPDLWVFTGAQVLTRGFVNSTAVVAAITVVEEAPEGARAFSTAMLGLAGGFGFGAAVLLLKVGDLGSWGWRVPYVLSGLCLLLVPKLARHLVESRRYRSLETTAISRGRVREVLSRPFAPRFVVLGLVAFLTNVFSAPSAQLTNRFLQDERSFSGFQVTLFRGVTGTLPGLIGLVVAIRLTEGRGRRPVAVVALLLGTACQMLFFLGHGGALWLWAALAILLGSGAGLAISTLSAEIFPTRVRATSNALLLVLGVAGSVVGLVLAGNLSDRLGGLGHAIAILGIGSLLASVALVPLLPESAGRRLDEVSDSITPPDPPLPPML